MRTLNISLLLAFLSIFGLPPKGSQGVVHVNYPPDRVVMEYGLLSLSLSVVQGSIDLIEIGVNNKRQARIVPKQEINDLVVPLELGLNKIDIVAKHGDRTLKQLTLSVFRRSELVSRHGKPPTGFRKDYFHMKDRDRCASCHTLQPRASDKMTIDMATFAAQSGDLKAKGTATSTCYSCHKAVTSYPFVHGPTSVWSCLSCHNPEEEATYATKKPEKDLCFTCHVKQKQDWESRRYSHAPLNTGKCGICHNPHASGDRFHLVSPAWILCFSCHTDKGDGRHVVMKYLPVDRHPTHGVRDPLREGYELTCASCHDPHASDSPNFSKLGDQVGFVLCKKCHIDRGIFVPFGLF